MSLNILVTGAAGYLGGSVASFFAQRKEGPIKDANLFAAVRSEEQEKSFSKVPNVTVIRADLKDEEGMIQAILDNQISFIIHTATCLDKDVILNLIKGLSKQREVSGKPTYLMHTSGASVFDQTTGWPFDNASDDDPLYEREKESQDSYIVREVDVYTTDQAETFGVNSVVMMPVNVYGRGLGPWNQLSIHFPGQIKTSIKQKRVHKFTEKKVMPLVHILDLVEYYARLTEAILEQREVPMGKQGYYMVLSHSTSWWDILDGFAKVLYARGLIDDKETYVWPSDEFAANALEMPINYARSIYNSGSHVVARNKKYIDWEPTWTTERFLDELESEVTDTLELDTSRTSLLRAIHSESSRQKT